MLCEGVWWHGAYLVCLSFSKCTVRLLQWLQARGIYSVCVLLLSMLCMDELPTVCEWGCNSEDSQLSLSPHTHALSHCHDFSFVLWCGRKGSVIVCLLNLWCCFLFMVQLTILIGDLCRASTLIYCQYIYCRFLKGLWYSEINLHIFVVVCDIWMSVAAELTLTNRPSIGSLLSHDS